MNKYNLHFKKEETEEMLDYIDRASRLSPKQILYYIGKMRDFIYNNMTPEGRKYLRLQKESKLEGKVSEYPLK